MNRLEEIQEIIKNFIYEKQERKQQISEIEDKRTKLAQERNDKKRINENSENAYGTECIAEVNELGKQITELGNQSQELQNKLDSKFYEVKTKINSIIDNSIAEGIRAIRKIEEEKQEMESKISIQEQRKAKYEVQKENFFARFGRIPDISENALKESEEQEKECNAYKARVAEIAQQIEQFQQELEKSARIKKEFKDGNWSAILEENAVVIQEAKEQEEVESVISENIVEEDVVAENSEIQNVVEENVAIENTVVENAEVEQETPENNIQNAIEEEEDAITLVDLLTENDENTVNAIEEVKTEEAQPIEEIELEEITPLELAEIQTVEVETPVQVQEVEISPEANAGKVVTKEFKTFGSGEDEEEETTWQMQQYFEDEQDEKVTPVQTVTEQQIEQPETIEQVQATEEKTEAIESAQIIEEKQEQTGNITNEIEEMAKAIIEEIEKENNVQKIEEQQVENVQPIVEKKVEEKIAQEPAEEEKEIIEYKEEKQERKTGISFGERVTLLGIIAKIEKGELVYKAQTSNDDEIVIYPTKTSVGNLLAKDKESREDLKEVLINYAVAEYRAFDKKVIKKIDPTVCEILVEFAKKYNYDVQSLIYNYAMTFSKNEDNDADIIAPITYNLYLGEDVNLTKKEKETLNKICKNAKKNSKIDIIGCASGFGKIKYLFKRSFSANNVEALTEGR